MKPINFYHLNLHFTPFGKALPLLVPISYSLWLSGTILLLKKTGLQKFLGQIFFFFLKLSRDTFLTVFASLEFLFIFNNPMTCGLKLLQKTFSAEAHIYSSGGQSIRKTAKNASL